MSRKHLEARERCPHLPPVERVWTADDMVRYRGAYDAEFYEAALSYAQSLWLEGKPAQALLQMNKALMADLQGGADSLPVPLPYAAKVWVMRNSPAGEFLGNPVRHYQHLATRMSGPRPELRRWRAWACLHLSEAVLPNREYPRDEVQIAREGVLVPESGEVLPPLRSLGMRGEADLVESVLEGERATGKRGY